MSYNQLYDIIFNWDQINIIECNNLLFATYYIIIQNNSLYLYYVVIQVGPLQNSGTLGLRVI